MTQRYDFVPFAVARKTDEGFLFDTPIVGRVGIQVYTNADGSLRRELRLPDEVFKADSLATFKGKPITVDHPAAGKVTAGNAATVTVGAMLSEGKQDGETVKADIVIHAADAIGERRQLSLGYDVEVEDSPGEHPVYGKYDAIQRNIAVNHLSVVKAGRAGVARLNVDGNEVPPETNQPEKVQMPKLKLDSGLEYEVPAEVIVEHQRLTGTLATTKAALDAVPAKIAGLEAERDGLKAKVDGIPALLEKAKTDAAAELQTRAKLEATATAFKVKVDAAMTPRAIKEAVIKATNPKFDGKDKSDAYVDAAFDFAVENGDAAAMAAQRLAANGGAGGSGSTNNDGQTDSRSAYDKYMDELHAGTHGKEKAKA